MKVVRQIGSLAFVLGLFVAVFAGVPWKVMVEDEPPFPWWPQPPWPWRTTPRLRRRTKGKRGDSSGLASDGGGFPR